MTIKALAKYFADILRENNKSDPAAVLDAQNMLIEYGIEAGLSQFFPGNGGDECVVIVLPGITMQELEE